MTVAAVAAVHGTAVSRGAPTAAVSVSEAPLDYARRALSGKERDVCEILLLTHGALISMRTLPTRPVQHALVAAVSSGEANFKPEPHPGVSDERRARLRLQMERDGMLGRFPPIDPNNPYAMTIDEEPAQKRCPYVAWPPTSTSCCGNS